MTKNKYNLTTKQIKKLKVNRDKLNEILLDEAKRKELKLWRNNVINAWCISENTCKNDLDEIYGTYDDYWIGFYDVNASAYAGKFRFYLTAYDGMCGYNFNKFYQKEDIENDMDKRIQSMFLAKINKLIDLGILEV